MERGQFRERQKQRQQQHSAKSVAELRQPQRLKRTSSSQRRRNRAATPSLPTDKSNVSLQGKPNPLNPTAKRAARRPNKRQVPVTQTPRNRKVSPVRSRSRSPLLYGIRLLIVGLGIGAIAGTILSAWDPTTRHSAENTALATAEVEATLPANAQTFELKQNQELEALKSQIETLAAKNPKLEPGAFFLDMETGEYLDFQGSSTFSAASTIKLPILIAFFQDVDAGKVRLDEELVMDKEVIGGGSGDMQYQKPGTKFTALETATKMMTISDNTATNMLIVRLGGIGALNERFRDWGLNVTTLNNLLPDLPGTNLTSPKELVTAMAMVSHGNIVSVTSRDRILDIMRRVVTNTLLPRGLGKGSRIAHKTGDIGSLVGDVGLIDMPMGRRYLAAVMVKRSHNDPAAQELIRQISRTAYEYLGKPAPSPSSTPSPFTTTEPFTN